MLTKSDRNLSYEQMQTMQAMWPDNTVVTASNGPYTLTPANPPEKYHTGGLIPAGVTYTLEPDTPPVIIPPGGKYDVNGVSAVVAMPSYGGFTVNPPSEWEKQYRANNEKFNPEQPSGQVDTVSIPPETIKRIQEQFPATRSKNSDIRNSGMPDMSKEAVKADSGKPDWSLVPFEALEGMVRVLEFGANKYSRNNWMTNGGFSYRRVLTACMRHLFAYLSGEDKDPESGLSHIHHAQCNLLFLAMYLTNKEKFNKDDRESR